MDEELGHVSLCLQGPLNIFVAVWGTYTPKKKQEWLRRTNGYKETRRRRRLIQTIFWPLPFSDLELTDHGPLPPIFSHQQQNSKETTRNSKLKITQSHHQHDGQNTRQNTNAWLWRWYQGLAHLATPCLPACLLALGIAEPSFYGPPNSKSF